jgi:hypothetical protein
MGKLIEVCEPEIGCTECVILLVFITSQAFCLEQAAGNHQSIASRSGL